MNDAKGATGWRSDSRTISGAVAEYLRGMIRGGQLLPGTRLRQNEIAAQFEVSTTPVREAFALLQQEGLVIREENKGVVVFEPTLSDLRETYLIRIPLEALAVEHAVPNLTEGDLEVLRGTVAEMSDIDVSTGNDARSLANQTFHSTIYRAAKLPRLFSLIEDLRASSSAYMRLFGLFHPDFAESVTEHEAVLRACEARDAAEAARLMVEHLEHTVTVVSRGLAESGGSLKASSTPAER